MVHLADCAHYVFPDVVIVCQTPQITGRNGIDVLENPEVIIEVLSDSTELFDRSGMPASEKFDCYKQIPSVSEYVLVSSKKKKVEVFRRTNANEWLLHDYRTDDEPVTIGTRAFQLSEIYRKVALASDEQRTYFRYRQAISYQQVKTRPENQRIFGI